MLIRRLRPHDPSSDDPELVLLDHGLYRELDDEFRINYCNLWVAIIHADEAKIKDYARILCGPDASYQLFACMLTARAWERYHCLPLSSCTHARTHARIYTSASGPSRQAGLMCDAPH